MAKTHRVVFLSDVHPPYHDKVAVQLARDIIADIKPDTLFFGGDMIDMYAVSDFDRDPERVVKFQDEFDEAVDVLAGFRKLGKDALFLPGNHEERWERYRHRHAEISSLRNAQLESLLELKKLKIGLLEHGKDFRIGQLYYMHGDEVAAGSTYVARNFYLKEQGSVVFGHYHRAQVFYNRLKGGEVHGSWASPCLCLLKQQYTRGTTQWSQGFSVITYYGDKFHVDQVVFFSDGKRLYGSFGDQLYSRPL